ncbi:MAG: hypothetical protein OSA99_17625, partial [Acidimicrobiales bacterium]|nr:hypothetical protein [Acidimicrobiales bacterium]
MHVVVAIVVVGLLYLGLFHTTINRWVVVITAVVASNVAHLAAGVVPPLLLVAEYFAMFLVLAVGFATRTIDDVVHDLEDLHVDPAAVRADGVMLAEHLESEGFTRAPEGWLHFERHGWDAIALRRDATVAFMVSGDRGPLIEFTSTLEDGRVLMTVPRARDRVPKSVLRQCFPDADVDTLLREHATALDWLRRNGCTAATIEMDDLTEHALGAERAHAGARGGPVGSMIRELRRQHLDVGSVVNRHSA